MLDFDEILQDVGEFGLYQKLILCFVLVPGVLPCGFHAYNQLFMAAEPDHWCYVPELAHRNLSTEMIKNISLPLEERDGILAYSQCRMFDLNYTALGNEQEEMVSETNGGNVMFLSRPDQDTVPTIPCIHGWDYDYSQYVNTVVSEWDLVCDRDFYPTLALAVLGAGGLLGNLIFGYLQDRIGRRQSFFACLAVQCAFGIATAFAKNISAWTALRFGVGLTVPALLSSPMVLAIELVGPSQRTLCTLVTNFAYSLCLILLAGVAFLVREWRQLALATSVPFLVFFFYWWIFPESPRWLLANGSFEEAQKIITTMAKVNGKILPSNYMVLLKRQYRVEQLVREKEKEKNIQKTYGFMDLLRTPNMRRKTIIITLLWFMSTSVYVGLSFYATALGTRHSRANKGKGGAPAEHVTFLLSGFSELPIYLFLWPTLDHWGRRWTLVIGFILGGFACLATAFSQGKPLMTLILYCVGKLGISSSFLVLQLMSSELYPTVVRGVGMAFSTGAGIFGCIFVPFLNYVGSSYLFLPIATMGGMQIISCVAALILPETLHQRLPETLEEGEQFGKDQSWSEWLQCCPKKPDNADLHSEARRRFTDIDDERIEHIE